MGIIKDWLALPFILLGSWFYSIGEFISGKKFSRRADMVRDEMTIGSMNRHQRRSLKHTIK